MSEHDEYDDDFIEKRKLRSTRLETNDEGTVYVEKRKRVLTKDDVDEIVRSMYKIRDEHNLDYKCTGKNCPVESDELIESVKFYKNLNAFFDGSKKTIWNLILSALVIGLIGLISKGYWAK
jgi:hypothetical protein